jgi:hypothetical protein
MTAGEISRALGCTRREVNSVLYKNTGIEFRHTTDEKPKWSLIDDSVTVVVRPDRVSLPATTSGPIHIDFQGGDWTIEIRRQDLSRNDPPFLIERAGDHRRIITISNAYDSDGADDAKLSAAGLVLAASALVWEIAIQRGVVDEEKFDLDIAVRDVLLSLAAHESRIRDDSPDVGATI